MTFKPLDHRFMRRALALARRGRGRTAPNPMVGCVLVKDGRVVGEGWHKLYGGPHAEAEALKAAGEKAKGAVAYITLEPCRPFAGKKTAPCADALVKAGIKEAVVAQRDPNPAVSGRGLSHLRRAGVKLRVGLRREQAESLNRDFIGRMRRCRPYVILKSALSLDGRAYAASGRSRWITSEPARKSSRALRARCDAILVGVGTVLKDDPSLTSHGHGRDPVRVVLDTRLRTPKRAKLLDGRAPTWVFTSSRGRLPGAEMIRVPATRRGLKLREVLRELARRGIGSLLVEGGPSVHASFLREGLVDEARIFIAPKLISGADDPNRGPRLARPRVKKVGADFLFYGKVKG